MPERERTDAGTFVEKVTLDAVRGVFEEVRGPVITSSDVADQLNCTTEAARQKLTRLYDRGEVDKRKTGRTVVYWQTGGERITPEERANDKHAEKARERDMAMSDEKPDQTPTDESDSTTDDLAAEVREYLEDAGQPPKTAHGRGVVLDVFKLLREDGPLKTGELQDAIYPDYTEHWGSGRTMWNAVDRYLEDIPGVEKGGYGEWAYAGDETVRETLDDVQTDGGIYDPTEEF